MKKIVSLFMFLFMAAGVASAACNHETGACRISDLQKNSQVKVVQEKITTSQIEKPKVKVDEKKPTFKQFIVSLLKP